MATVRRYGPSLDAGVVIIEKPPEPQIVPSPFGITSWAGILEKGPTDELIVTLSKSDFVRQTGGRIPDSLVPDAGEAFWKVGQGAGRLNLIRVTDGTGRKAYTNFLSRETTGVGNGKWRELLKGEGYSVGRWAGGMNRRVGEITGAGDLTETTIDTGLTLKEDEFSGGLLYMTAISGKSYEITGNTTAGVVTLASDSTLLTDFGSSVEYEFTLWKDNANSLGNERKLAVVWKDGARDPVNEFGIEVYEHDLLVQGLDIPDLSMDPNSDVYVLDVINKLTGNYELFLTDLFTGAITANVRPANHFGLIPTAGLTATTMEIEWYQAWNDPSNTGDGTIGSFTAGTEVQRDLLTLTATSATTFDVVSSAQDKTFPAATVGTPYTAENKYSVGFTITAGGTAFIAGDIIYVRIEPLVEDQAIGGKVFYDYDNNPRDYLEIIDNDETSITVRVGNDLTALSAVGNQYRLEYRQAFWWGYDGHSGVAATDYQQVWDPGTSLFNQMADKRLGLIKYGMPGVTDTDAQKDMRAYASAKNGVARLEIPSTVTTEVGAVAYVEDTLGRYDYQEIIFPSYYDKSNPDGAGLKRISATGAVQGIEALFAKNWQGYHKAAAGEDAIIEEIRELPTGDKVLDGEMLNNKGIQRIAEKAGNWVVWGDRIPATSSGIFWKHKREQLSHYERVLQENFGWIIFAINDELEQPKLLSALKAYFLPEWTPKRALRGKTFREAVEIKIDSENNTDATRAAGDMNAEITLKLADTVERFIITIGQAGIFEDTTQ